MAKETFEMELPNILFQPFIQNIQNLISNVSKAHLRQINDLLISNLEWEKLILKYLNHIHQRLLLPFDGKVILSDRSALIYSIVNLLSFSKRSYSGAEFEYWLSRIASIIELIPEDEAVKITIKDSLELPLRKSNNKRDRKEISQNQAQIFWEICSDYSVETFLFIVFSLMFLLSNSYSDNEFKHSVYTPLDREVYRSVCKTLKQIKTEESINPYVEFFSWEKLCIFECVLGRFLRENIFIEINQEGLGHSFTPVHEIKEIDLLKELKKKANLIDIKKIIGREEIKLLKKNNLFSLECLTPDRISRHITICISGFLSEDDNHYKAWENLAEYNIHSHIFTIKWASNKKSKFKGLAIKSFFPILLKKIAPKYLDTLVKGFGSNASDFQKIFLDARTQAKITGKILALCLILKYPFPTQSVSLVGFSLGTLVITQCLKQLHQFKAFNLVHDVYLFGGAANIPPHKINKWQKRFYIINGRLVNCHTSRDWVLTFYKYVLNADPIGLKSFNPLKIEHDPDVVIKSKLHLENYNLSKFIRGHFNYRKKFCRIFKQVNYQ